MKNPALAHKLSILLGTIALGWLGSIEIVSANPNVFKVDRTQTTKIKNINSVTIIGNLSPDTSENLSHPVYQTPCSEIGINLWRNGKVKKSTQAVGSTIANGCTYRLDTGMSPQLIYAAGKFSIGAYGSTTQDIVGIQAHQDINQPFPSQVDLKVYAVSRAPK